MAIITKSRYTHGLWCPSLLWYEVNAKERLPEVDADSQANMDEGTKVGELATQLYTDGRLIEGGFQEAIAWTKQAIKAGKPVFEAALPYENLYCKVDILNPVKGGWELIEVKKSTKVKPEYLDDVAFQLYVAEKAGLNVTAVKLMHINKEYVRAGELELDKLFHAEDVTAEARARLAGVPANVSRLVEMLNGPEPQLERAHICSHPYGCPLTVFDDNPLADMFWGGAKAAALVNSGIDSWALIPDDKLNVKQKIQRDAILAKKMFVDKKGLNSFLSSLQYPLYHVDFETIGGAVPPLDGMRPYEQAPFQVSLHIEAEDGSLTHYAYLGSGGDPRAGVVDVLRKIGPTGSLIAYNAGFEQKCIAGLASMFPDDKAFLLSLNERFVDLLQPFKDFVVHHPDQHGANSLKAVLPALTGTSYAGLDIANGGDAQREYVRVYMNGPVSDEEKKYREAALKYCALDTQAMVDVVRVLRGL